MMSDTSKTNKFVILGIQRSGTTLLQTLLSSHPEILCVGETFKVAPPRGINPYTDEYGFLWYIKQSRTRQIRLRLDRRRLTQEYLDYLYGLPGYQAIGFKFMLNQGKEFPKAIPYLQSNEIKKIHVIRKNVLKTFVSRVTAQTRRFHHSEKPVDPIKIYVPIKRMKKVLEKIDSDNQRLRELFSKDRGYMPIYYEDFAEDKESGIRQVTSFIGVSDGNVHSPLKKINPDKLSELIENYEEVSRELKGTRFEWCLD